MCAACGHIVCIVIMWFALVLGLGPVHPIKDGCQLVAAGKTLKLETSLECDYLSIHFKGHANKEECKIQRKELNSSVKHNKINGMCE